MPDWDEIFAQKGYVFVDPHPDMSRLVTIFQKGNVKKILDLGCGTGRNLVSLSRAGFDTVGFDCSTTALELTRQWLEEEDLEAELDIGKMEEPFPYPDSFFDAIISVQVIHHNHMVDILSTVSEIERVIKTGGFLFVTVPILGSKPENPKDDWNLDWIEPGTYIPQCGPESGIPHHYFTEEELREVFRNFEILEMYMDDTNHRCVLAIKKP